MLPHKQIIEVTNAFGTKMAILCNISQENVSYDTLKRKNALLGYKKKKLKKLTHRFGPKMNIFKAFFFLGKISRENVFF